MPDCNTGTWESQDDHHKATLTCQNPFVTTQQKQHQSNWELTVVYPATGQSVFHITYMFFLQQCQLYFPYSSNNLWVYKEMFSEAKYNGRIVQIAVNSKVSEYKLPNSSSWRSVVSTVHAIWQPNFVSVERTRIFTDRSTYWTDWRKGSVPLYYEEWGTC